MDDVGSIVEPTSSLAWADVIHANFQRVISRYIKNVSTCLSSKAQRGLRTIFIQKSKLKYAYLPSKIVSVWIDRFCVHYDWWRRLQPTSLVSPVWFHAVHQGYTAWNKTQSHVVLYFILACRFCGSDILLLLICRTWDCHKHFCKYHSSKTVNSVKTCKTLESSMNCNFV